MILFFVAAISKALPTKEEFNSICGDAPTFSSNFSSPGWFESEPYPANLNCSWDLKSSLSSDDSCFHQLELLFLDVEEASRDGTCAFDRLIIQTDAGRWELCGDTAEDLETIRFREATIEFQSDEMFEGFGWNFRLDYCQESTTESSTTERVEVFNDSSFHEMNENDESAFMEIPEFGSFSEATQTTATSTTRTRTTEMTMETTEIELMKELLGDLDFLDTSGGESIFLSGWSFDENDSWWED